MQHHQERTNVERAADGALLGMGMVLALGGLRGLFLRRRAYGRTPAGAAWLFVLIAVPFFLWGALAPNGNAVVAILLPVVLGVPAWLLAIKLICGWDRLHGRQQRWLGHWATLEEIDDARQRVVAEYHQRMGALPLDLLLGAGYGHGASLGVDLAMLDRLRAVWAELERAEAAIRHGEGWWVQDGPAQPQPLLQQLGFVGRSTPRGATAAPGSSGGQRTLGAGQAPGPEAPATRLQRERPKLFWSLIAGLVLLPVAVGVPIAVVSGEHSSAVETPSDYFGGTTTLPAGSQPVSQVATTHACIADVRGNDFSNSQYQTYMERAFWDCSNLNTMALTAGKYKGTAPAPAQGCEAPPNGSRGALAPSSPVCLDYYARIEVLGGALDPTTGLLSENDATVNAAEQVLESFNLATDHGIAMPDAPPLTTTTTTTSPPITAPAATTPPVAPADVPPSSTMDQAASDLLESCGSINQGPAALQEGTLGELVLEVYAAVQALPPGVGTSGREGRAVVAINRLSQDLTANAASPTIAADVHAAVTACAGL